MSLLENNVIRFYVYLPRVGFCFILYALLFTDKTTLLSTDDNIDAATIPQ